MPLNSVFKIGIVATVIFVPYAAYYLNPTVYSFNTTKSLLKSNDLELYFKKREEYIKMLGK